MHGCSERKASIPYYLRYVLLQGFGTTTLISHSGDLGMTPESVEVNLDFNFQLAQSWGCVLLLDEADVFLAERSKTDLARNALVSGECAMRNVL